MKFIKFEKIKFTVIISILFLLYIYLLATNYTYAVSEDLSDSVLRLHVIANSDAIEDQNLKYKVRDNIINYMNSISENITSKEEALELAKNNKENFLNIAKQTIMENGFNYDVNIDFGNFHFPTKSYGDISFPAGNYDAIKIEIGKSQGQNWWCVMFPPLCFVDVSSGIVPEESKDTIKDSLTNEEYSLIANGNSESSTDTVIKFKFKLIELLNNTNISTAHKDI